MKSQKNNTNKLRQYFIVTLMFVMTLSLGLFSFVPKASAGTGFSLTTSTPKIQQNNQFNVGVKLTTTDPVLTISVCLDYPQDKLQFVGVDYAGSVFGTPAPGNSKCTIYFERFTTSEVTGSNLHVATLTFKMLVSSGNADITFGKFTEAYTPPKLSLTNNNLTVSGAPIPPPASSTNNSSTPPSSTSGGTKTTRSVAATNQNITRVETPKQEELAAQAPPAEVTDEEVSLPVTTTAQKKQNTSIAAIVGSIAGLVGIVAVVIFFIGKNKRKDKSGPLSPDGTNSGQGLPMPPNLGTGMRELS